MMSKAWWPTGSMLDFGQSSLGSRHVLGNCVLFLDKTLHSYSASSHTGVYMGKGKCNARSNPAIEKHHIQVGGRW